jgi:hypothetical protein
VSSRCSECDSPLDEVQRYCVVCGHAREPTGAAAAPVAAAVPPPPGAGRLLRRLPRFPFPTPREAAAFVLVSLTVGVITGRAIDADPLAIASGAGDPVAQTAAADGDAAGGSPSLEAPPGNVAAPASDSSGDSSDTTAAVDDTAEPVPEPSEPAETPAEDPAPQAEKPKKKKGVAAGGTVVHVNPAAWSYALATDSGELLAVHAKELPDEGAHLTGRIEKLANGTYRELSSESEGIDGSARLEGTVTYASAEDRAYVVSAPGVSMVVHSAEGRPLPQPPALVSVQLSREETDERLPASWSESTLELKGVASGPVDLEGIVQALDPAARTLDLSADDTRQTGRDIRLALPPQADMALLRPGQVIAGSVEIGVDGSYRIVGAFADGGLRAAGAKALFAPAPVE